MTAGQHVRSLFMTSQNRPVVLVSANRTPVGGRRNLAHGWSAPQGLLSCCLQRAEGV